MKRIALVLMLLALAGCANMTPREKQTAYIVGGIVVGAIIISANDGGNTTVHNHKCLPHSRCN